MNKATIRSNISQYIPDVQATNDQGFDYIFGETNSYSCHVRPVRHRKYRLIGIYLGRARCLKRRRLSDMGLGLLAFCVRQLSLYFSFLQTLNIYQCNHWDKADILPRRNWFQV